MKQIALMLLIGMLAACQPVKETHQLAQPAGQQLAAKPGDTVLTIVKEKNLPSEIIEGKADLLGRKTMTGLTTLQYRGLEGNRAVFKQRTMLMQSDATDLHPSNKPTVANDGDKNIFVNLAQPGRRVVVVERRTLVIERAGADGLVYSIIDTAPQAAAAATSTENKPAMPATSAVQAPGQLNKPQWEKDFLNFVTMGNAS